MGLALFRFKVTSGTAHEARQGVLAHPRPVDNTLGAEVFTDIEDSNTFFFITRWTADRFFRAWHGISPLDRSLLGIPTSLKMAPNSTKTIHLARADDPAEEMNPGLLATDFMPALGRFLAESRSVHLLVAALDGTVRLSNAALAAALKMAPAEAGGRRVWDLLTEHDARSLRQRVGEKQGRSSGNFLLNFVDADHFPFTLECQLEVQSDCFLLLGEVPQRTNESDQEEMLRLNNELAVLNRENVRRGRELERALEELNTSHWHLKKIQEVLPICMECGKVKTTSRWEEVLTYLKKNALFLSHGYCPACLVKVKEQWGLTS